MFCIIGVLGNTVKFTESTCSRVSFFMKFVTSAYNFILRNFKETLFLKEHLWWLLLNGCSFQRLLANLSDFQNLSWFLSYGNSEGFRRFQKQATKVYEVMFFICKNMDYCFLVESTEIGNATFLYETALSAANAKANKMERTKWTYHKEGSFTSSYPIFLKVLFQCKSLL